MLREAAGSLLVVGLAGAELSSLERTWLRLIRPGGVILFRRNIVEASRTRALLDESTALCARHAFRCVDVEGGSVDRLRDALAPLPSAQTVAAAAKNLSTKRRSGSSAAAEHGALVASAVSAFGFNTTLAPVLDLGLPDAKEVLGTRTAGDNPADIVSYARDFLRGLQKHGVAGCGKHFPGLGGGMRDSHLETPSIERTWDLLWQQDLQPYVALSRELPMIMINHAAYPLTRSGVLPASVSSFWITKILREKIGYRGLVFSDDLEMGGILKFMPMEEAVIAAFRAGMDMVEICHSPELILRAFEALLSEGERSPSFARLLMTRARETARKRSRMFGAPRAAAPTAKQLERLRQEIRKFGDQIATAEPATPRAEPTLVETA